MTPKISPRLLALFARYGERYVARSFHAVRLSKVQWPDTRALRGRPLVVCLNHPSWWDPMICLLLATRLFPDRRHYAPIEAAALSKYRFFEKLGFFGIEPGTVRGARRFLEVGREIVEQRDSVLWITAAGRFADPRERPVHLRPGLGHLVCRMKEGFVLPLALEYPFWEERFPEALARFGRAVTVEETSMRASDWTAVLGAWLESAQDELTAEALERDPARFELLLGGRAGVGGTYDLWRRLEARLRGERFEAAHGVKP
ncbi:MAG: lysophospholipid acyltransferase family protein [Thermoanaerobaculia bacterium]